MHRALLVTGCMMALAAASPALAATISDPTGDFIPSFVGDHDADLDVTLFSVAFDDGADLFRLRAEMAGDIDPGKPGLYVIGVNTGAAVAPGPFAGIGAPGVIFNRVVIVQKSGAATLSGANLVSSVFDNVFTVEVPLALLASTGFAPQDYGWNLWPRNGIGDNSQISDFAPDNSTLAAGVPEPATWGLMIAGLGLAGAVLRRRALRTAVPV